MRFQHVASRALLCRRWVSKSTEAGSGTEALRLVGRAVGWAAFEGRYIRTGSPGASHFDMRRHARSMRRVSFCADRNSLNANSLGRCRAQGSLRGRIARLRMGFVEKMPHWLPARYVRGPRRSLRGHLPFVPAGTPSARAEALSGLVSFSPSRLSATRTRCRCTRLRAG
jgi:hypothetical protein